MLSICTLLLGALIPTDQEPVETVYTHGQALAAYALDTEAAVETVEAWAAYRAQAGELRAGGAGERALTLVRQHAVAAFEDRPGFDVLVFELPELPWKDKKPLATAVTATLDLILTTWHPAAARDVGRMRSGKVGKFKGQRLPFELGDGRSGALYVVDTPGAELGFFLIAADDDAFNKARRDFEKAFKGLEADDPSEPAAPLAAASWETAISAPRPAPVAGDLRDSVAGGVGWLIENQDSDGGWTIAPGTGNTANQFGVVGLALHALVDGSALLDSEGQAACQQAAHRAAAWLLKHRANAGTEHPGVFGPIAAGSTTYNHLVATRALLAYRAKWKGEVGEPAALEVGLHDALSLILRWQKPSGGWSYAVSCGEDPERWDSSITSWALLCLVAAREQGLPSDDDALLRGAQVLDELASEETGRIGYCLWVERGGKGGLPARLAETHGAFPSHRSEALTAIGFHAQQRVWAALRRQTEDGAPIPFGALAVKQVELMLAQPPVEDDEAYDLYYWAHAAKAMAALGGPERAAWEAATAHALLLRQEPLDGEASIAGSWAPESAWAIEGDRAYTTAQACLTLAAWAQPTHLLRGVSRED